MTHKVFYKMDNTPMCNSSKTDWDENMFIDKHEIR